MDRSISATDANREFSRVLNEVASGQTYVVTTRGKPVMRMVPVDRDEADEAGRRARLKAFLEELAKHPAQNLGRVVRDDGYE
jgi:prevent-host-death family protein